MIGRPGGRTSALGIAIRDRRAVAYGGCLAITLTMALTPVTLAVDGTTDETEPTACQAPVLVTPMTDSSAEPSATRPDLSQGSWRRMANAPFGSEYEPVAWTGGRMVAVDLDTGRTAVYAPSRDRWREVSGSPRSAEAFTSYVWTGSELILAEVTQGGTKLGGLAYRPGDDRWRELAQLSVEADGEEDHVLTEPLWTGTHMIVADSMGLLAAYDPAADCWVELGRVPGQPWVWHLYQAGPHLLVESRHWDEPVELRTFDPATGIWSGPMLGPLDRDASEGGGSWVDGRLVYVTWYGDMHDGGALNAIFDPATMTWSTFDHDCATRASGTLAVGDLLIASDGRRALDGRSLACLDLPAPPRRLDGTERMVWTGSELVAWSGIKSLPEPPRRGGLVFRPANVEQPPFADDQ